MKTERTGNARLFREKTRKQREIPEDNLQYIIIRFTMMDSGKRINSIKSVVKRHNGECVPVLDKEKFSAFVALKLDDD